MTSKMNLLQVHKPHDVVGRARTDVMHRQIRRSTAWKKGLNEFPQASELSNWGERLVQQV